MASENKELIAFRSEVEDLFDLLLSELPKISYIREYIEEFMERHGIEKP